MARSYLLCAAVLAVVVGLCVADTLNDDSQDEGSVVASEGTPPVFVATDEWQDVAEGQAIPAGLHVQLDMSTGKRRAKLMEGGTQRPPALRGEAKDAKGSLIAVEKSIEMTEAERLALRERLKDLKDRPAEYANEFEARHDALRKAMEDAVRDLGLKGEGDGTSAEKGAPETGEEERPKTWEELKSSMEELEKALKMRSEIEILKELVEIVRNPNASASDRVDALNDMEDLVHQVDNARDLDSIGGLMPVIHAIDDTNEDIRATAALVLGSAMQSNPPVQLRALEYGAIPRLVSLAADGSDIGARRALYALASIARHYPQAQELIFGPEEHRAHLLAVFNRDDAGPRTKLCTLLSDLLGGTPGAPDATGTAAAKWLPTALVPDAEEEAAQHEGDNGRNPHVWCDAVSLGLSGHTNADVESSLRAMGALMDRCGAHYAATGKEEVVRALAQSWVAQAESAHKEGGDEYLGQLVDVSEFVADRIRRCPGMCVPAKEVRRVLRHDPADL
eukprot:Opistho-1_new@67729